MRPPSPRRGQLPLAACLGELAEPLSAAADAPSLRAQAAWIAACGAPLAAHGRPLGWTPEGFLRIGVWERDWREILFEQRGPLCARLRRRLPQLRGLRLEQIEPPPPPPPRRAALVAPPRPETASLAESPALRAAFDRLLAARDRGRPT
ncbi:MAG: DUF721 domain-containing protein [Myxococcales bacterium]|nr:DUF721 domain-containing protein [Myxococcales bacterium]